MKTEHIQDIRRINQLTTELESLYHLASAKLGMADSVSIVMYALYQAGGECLLADIYKESGISKQTINSALRKLEAEGMVTLAQHSGRAKKVIQTDAGKSYAQATTARLVEAEAAAFAAWTEEDFRICSQLMSSYADSFRQQIEKL